jgi:hypothetical protein
MYHHQLRRSSRSLIIVPAVLALVLGGCRTSQPLEVKTDPALPTNSQPDSKTVTEKPSLTGRIENVSIYPVPNRPKDLAVSLVVSITNTGSPTTAQGWNLEINSPGRPTPTALEPVHVNGLVEMPGTNGKKVDLAKEDLVLKTAQVPIANGAQAKGILTFVLLGTAENALSNNQTSLTIHFKDSRSNPYQTPKSVIGSKTVRP